ncbi:CHAT domain-containing protein [Paractinoplanes atraurantiacus]|uniref:CHAT domain-containing protein n=1 Tax=Paractinoplanes atraurantiacus TaxID=1036182 RepID=UPI001177E86F|nr:CHAT domain-containing protein [Actinoplanes atraurantiacus]
MKYAQHSEFDRALRRLNEAVDVVASCREYLAAAEAARYVLLAAATIGQNAEEPVQEATYKLYRRIAFVLSDTRVEINTMLALHEASKGANFSSVLRENQGRTLPETIEPLLREVWQSEQDIPGPMLEPEMPYGAETVAFFYAGSHEAEDVSDPYTRHRNLQRKADQEITNHLYADVEASQLSLPDVEDIQAAIPADAVLISLFLGESHHPSQPRPLAAVQGLAVTREGIDFRTSTGVNAPGGLLELRRGDQVLMASPAIAEVDVLRHAVLEDPLHRRLAPEAEDRLKGEAHALCAGFLRSTTRWLSEGKRHLIIWPNGPLHFVPFHLLMHDGWTVADDWTVTQTANLMPFRAKQEPNEARQAKDLIVFAFAGGRAEHGLPAAEGLEAHAEALVATVGAGVAVTGSAATPRRLIAMARGARYLHIAAHGAHNEWAPWFQCVFLSPDENSDGRLFAYDVLHADLRGVELVTLSSCESALGRFDMNDNLRGIPAAFLAAGAAAVVGCSWPVHPAVALDFFGSLYRHLSLGMDRVSAFRAAQVDARAHHPAYRDWGAFVYVGDWT